MSVQRYPYWEGRGYVYRYGNHAGGSTSTVNSSSLQSIACLFLHKKISSSCHFLSTYLYLSIPCYIVLLRTSYGPVKSHDCERANRRSRRSTLSLRHDNTQITPFLVSKLVSILQITKITCQAPPIPMEKSVIHVQPLPLHVFFPPASPP